MIDNKKSKSGMNFTALYGTWQMTLEVAWTDGISNSTC